jgi:hypothetical protein
VDGRLFHSSYYAVPIKFLPGSWVGIVVDKLKLIFL